MRQSDKKKIASPGPRHAPLYKEQMLFVLSKFTDMGCSFSYRDVQHMHAAGILDVVFVLLPIDIASLCSK